MKSWFLCFLKQGTAAFVHSVHDLTTPSPTSPIQQLGSLHSYSIRSTLLLVLDKKESSGRKSPMIMEGSYLFKRGSASGIKGARMRFVSVPALLLTPLLFTHSPNSIALHCLLASSFLYLMESSLMRVDTEALTNWSLFLGSNLTDDEMRKDAMTLAMPVRHDDVYYGGLWCTCFRYLGVASGRIGSMPFQSLSPLQGMP
jgi:hypothetical protein